MNPIIKYIKNIFASQRVLGKDVRLQSLLSADFILQNLIDGKKIPGLSITVLREGETVFEKGYGYADMETESPINPQKTIFRIASVSKPIAATALAHMVSDGLIDLDTSFYQYVPYYPKKKWNFTIRQLAGHTAGIRGYKGVEYGLNKPYTIKESLEIFQDDDLLFEPSTSYNYNSFDWVLISLAMQEVSGIPFEEYVREKVLEPLGMEHTMAENETSVDERSRSYSRTGNFFREAIPVNNYYKLAGGGYLSTSADIAKLGQAYLDETILKTKIQSEFLTSEIINGQPTYYGLGWQVSEDKEGRPYYGHVGNGVGGYSNFFVYPNERMVFSILINCTNPNVQVELDEVIQILLTENLSL